MSTASRRRRLLWKSLGFTVAKGYPGAPERDTRAPAPWRVRAHRKMTTWRMVRALSRHFRQRYSPAVSVIPSFADFTKAIPFRGLARRRT